MLYLRPESIFVEGARRHAKVVANLEGIPKAKSGKFRLFRNVQKVVLTQNIRLGSLRRTKCTGSNTWV